MKKYICKHYNFMFCIFERKYQNGLLRAAHLRNPQLNIRITQGNLAYILILRQAAKTWKNIYASIIFFMFCIFGIIILYVSYTIGQVSEVRIRECRIKRKWRKNWSTIKRCIKETNGRQWQSHRYSVWIFSR